MPIMAESKSNKQFELPSEGVQPAVLAEVRDLGLVDVVYNGVSSKKPKVLFRYQLAELDGEGQPKRVYSRFTKSLHEKAALRKHIQQMFGKPVPASLDLEKLVGSQVQLVITHNEVGDKKYANIQAVLKPAAGAKKIEIIPIPKKDEVKAAVAQTTNAITEANPITDEDIPF
jgi:hypothetical protein